MEKNKLLTTEVANTLYDILTKILAREQFSTNYEWEDFSTDVMNKEDYSPDDRFVLFFDEAIQITLTSFSRFYTLNSFIYNYFNLEELENLVDVELFEVVFRIKSNENRMSFDLIFLTTKQLHLWRDVTVGSNVLEDCIFNLKDMISQLPLIDFKSTNYQNV
jgi:hypothetical protein